MIEKSLAAPQESQIQVPESCFGKIRSVAMQFGGKKVKIKVSHSLIAIGAVGVRVPLYLGHS